MFHEALFMKTAGIYNIENITSEPKIEESNFHN